jgi:hypothetical protein
MAGLHTYDPRWDQARVTGDSTRVYTDDGIVIATDFEGGNGAHIRPLGNDRYALALEPEPGNHRFSGFSYYYCVGVRNRRHNPRTVRICLRAKTPGNEAFGTGIRHAVIRRGGSWYHLDAKDIQPVPGCDDCLSLDIPLPGAGEPDSTLFVSDFHWWPYSEVVDYMHGLDGVLVREIGRSFLGRPIYAVEIGPPDAPRLVHAQTPQPSEMGHLACRAMIDWLCSDDPVAAPMRTRFRLCFIPVTNPDGAVLGHGVSDAQGRFPYFEGHLAAAGDPAATPETVAVWQYLQEQRPVLFWEWHSNNWDRRPGHMLLRYRPELLADTSRRRTWQDVDRRLLALPNTHHGNWTSHTEGIYQQSIGFQATTRLGAISCMIKQHDKYPLKQSRDHAIACLKEAAAALWYQGSQVKGE